MSTASADPAERSLLQLFLLVAGGGVFLVLAMLWIGGIYDQPPGLLFVRLAWIAPWVILAYLAATALEWLTRGEKDDSPRQSGPGWIARAHAFVSDLFLASVGAQLLLTTMLVAALLAAPTAVPRVAPLLITMVFGAVVGVMALRTFLYLAACAARLSVRLR